MIRIDMTEERTSVAYGCVSGVFERRSVTGTDILLLVTVTRRTVWIACILVSHTAEVSLRLYLLTVI